MEPSFACETPTCTTSLTNQSYISEQEQSLLIPSTGCRCCSTHPAETYTWQCAKSPPPGRSVPPSMGRTASFNQPPPAVRVQPKSPTESAGGWTVTAGDILIMVGTMGRSELPAKLTPQNENKAHGFNRRNSQLIVLSTWNRFVWVCQTLQNRELEITHLHPKS